MIVFEPRVWMVCKILVREPWPMAVPKITANTPMKMPSVVKLARNLLAASPRNAMEKFSKIGTGEVKHPRLGIGVKSCLMGERKHRWRKLPLMGEGKNWLILFVNYPIQRVIRQIKRRTGYFLKRIGDFFERNSQFI